MKNLVNQFYFVLLTLCLSNVFFSCSRDQQQSLETKEKSARVAAPLNSACAITGTGISVPRTALVSPGSTGTYTYSVGSGFVANNYAWTLTANPVGSASITSNGPNVTVTYSANFKCGTLQCIGSGGTDVCSDTVDITTPFTCNITGSTSVLAGSTVTYTYTTSSCSPVNVVWTMIANPVGSATITSNGSTVTVTYLSNFISGTLSAAGLGTTTQTCTSNLNIIKTNGTGGGTCACPSPSIKCVLAVSGGSPYWRLELNNPQVGETFTWSTLNATIMGGTNTTYIIVNPAGPLNSGFTVYCEVSKTCSDGTVGKRKAFYTNYYGGTTTSGTSGFINIGGVCDSSGSGALGAQ